MSREEYIAQAHMIGQQTIEMKPVETEGFVLDIGGGGEGIIGKLNGTKIVAIDRRLDELEETDSDVLKFVMPDETIETGYGSHLKRQDAQTLGALADDAGFKTTKVEA